MCKKIFLTEKTKYEISLRVIEFISNHGKNLSWNVFALVMTESTRNINEENTAGIYVLKNHRNIFFTGRTQTNN